MKIQLFTFTLHLLGSGVRGLLFKIIVVVATRRAAGLGVDEVVNGARLFCGGEAACRRVVVVVGGGWCGSVWRRAAQLVKYGADEPSSILRSLWSTLWTPMATLVDL